MMRVGFGRPAPYDAACLAGGGSLLFNGGVYEVVRSAVDVRVRIGRRIVGN